MSKKNALDTLLNFNPQIFFKGILKTPKHNKLIDHYGCFFKNNDEIMFASNTFTKSKYGILIKNPTHIVHTYNISKDDIIISSESIISRKKFDIINYGSRNDDFYT